jgi:hypothetical protein
LSVEHLGAENKRRNNYKVMQDYAKIPACEVGKGAHKTTLAAKEKDEI